MKMKLLEVEEGSQVNAVMTMRMSESLGAGQSQACVVMTTQQVEMMMTEMQDAQTVHSA